MKQTKRLFIFIICFALVASLFLLNTQVKANTTTYDDTKTGSWTPTEETVEKLNGVEHILAYGESTYQGAVSDQKINVFKLKTNGVTSKLVNWAVLDGNSGYKRAQLTKIAEDYEKNHPGWIVIAGINADQYAQVFGPGGGNNAYLNSSPYYPAIMDGDVRFPFVSVNGASSAYVGFTNDGSTDGIVDASPFKCFALYILDEAGNEIKEFELEGINKNASSNQTTAWTSLASNISSGGYIKKELNSSNNVFFVENADLSYAHTSSEYGEYDVIYSKGTISSTSSNIVIDKGQFAIETSNKEVIDALSVGTKIKVQAKFHSDEMNAVETAAGYHEIHRNNGVDATIPGYSPSQLNSQYDARQYNRSIFGQTADGTYVLVTADKSNGAVEGTKYKGLRFWETNAVLKHYGVTEAYQQDGGGSVTAIMRNANGSFDVVNTPSDSVSGTQRSVFNGLFFVVRDPGFDAKKTDITRNSVNITLKETNLYSQMSNIKVNLNNKTYDMTSESLLIEGLEEDTEYTAVITFDFLENGKTIKDSYELKFKTKAFQMPDSGLEISKINKESITVIKKNTEYASWIKNVYVYISGESYYMGDSNELVVENLISDTTYNVHFTYEVHEPATGNIYPATSEEQRITTTLIELPNITKFQVKEQTADYIKVEYQYEDEDDAVNWAYIICGDQKISLNKKRGTITIENLDKTKDTYTIILQLLYYPNPEASMFAEELKEELTVDSIKEEPVDPNPNPNPEPQPTPTPTPDNTNKGCSCSSTSAEIIISTLSALSIAILVLRKKK